MDKRMDPFQFLQAGNAVRVHLKSERLETAFRKEDREDAQWFEGEVLGGGEDGLVVDWGGSPVFFPWGSIAWVDLLAVGGIPIEETPGWKK